MQTGETTKRTGGHRKQLLTVAQKEIICDWIDLDCTQTLRSLRDKCLLEWPRMQISLSTINRALKEFHYLVKMVTCVPERRNTTKSL